MTKILVVAAHPDDEVLGCGATIASHVDRGDMVWALILGEGVMSRNILSLKQKKSALKNLKKDSTVANKILGVTKLILRDFPDNKFDSVPILEITQTIEKVISDFRPNLIYTHSKSDVNIDHRITLEALEPAIRPYSNKEIVDVYSFEIPSSTESNFVRKNFSPNFFVALDLQFLNKKVKALECYTGEVKKFPHPRSSEYLTHLASIRGAQSGVPYAEAFELVFSLKRNTG